MKMIGTPEEIVKTFPCKGLVKTINTGFNFYVYSNVNKWISFHYNKDPDKPNKAVLGTKTRAFKSGEEKEALLALVPLLTETKAVQKQTIKKHPHNVGTEACIAHILKKRDKIKEVHGKEANRTILTLSALADELKQFL